MHKGNLLRILNKAPVLRQGTRDMKIKDKSPCSGDSQVSFLTSKERIQGYRVCLLSLGTPQETPSTRRLSSPASESLSSLHERLFSALTTEGEAVLLLPCPASFLSF